MCPSTDEWIKKIYLKFSIYSSVHGHLSYFHVLVVVNSAAMNIRASRVALLLRIHLPMQEMQETQLWSLGQEDPMG